MKNCICFQVIISQRHTETEFVPICFDVRETRHRHTEKLGTWVTEEKLL
jgi:hypothetical protein